MWISLVSLSYFILTRPTVEQDSMQFTLLTAVADPGFSNRGGANDYVHASHISNAKHEVPFLLRAGSRARLMAMGALGF